MWKWSDLMFGLAIIQFLLLKPSIRWSHSSILRESYLLRASDTTERNSMNTYTPASFQNLQQSPQPQTVLFRERLAIMSFAKQALKACWYQPECACGECNRQKRVRPPMPSPLPSMASEQTRGHSLSFTLGNFVLGNRQLWTCHTEWQNTG
jgi:hypothetical protein